MNATLDLLRPVKIDLFKENILGRIGRLVG